MGSGKSCSSTLYVDSNSSAMRFKDKYLWQYTGDESYRPTECEACGFQLAHSREKRYSNERWTITNLQKLRDGIEDGCISCVWLEKGISHEICDSAELQDGIRVWASNGGRKTLLVRFPWSPAILSFFTSPRVGGYDDRTALPWDWPVGYSTSGDTSSDESFEWATRQLKACVENHPSCNEKIGSSLPTRVIDIGCSEEHTLKLHVSNGEAQPYACLSHCWGKTPLLITVRSNFDAHLAGIPWHSLPRTYQEAITFLRRLRIRYLWIDSLCIIQDDRNDWSTEAAKMPSIYQGAFITVTAAMSPDIADGLFSVTPPHKMACRRVGQLGPDGDAPSVWVREYLTHLGDSERQDGILGRWGIHGPSPSPHMTIYSRGWCLQERLLSPRVLYFGPDELSWECIEGAACECSGVMTTRAKPAQFSEQMKLYLSPHALKSYSREDLADAWKKVVEHYSCLQLTYDTDIFPAICGLVMQFEPLFGCRYLAGLWEARLLQDLLWSSHERRAPWPRRPEKWRAPTWSWASVKSPIYYHQDIVHNENSCVVQDVTCVPVAANLAGELASAVLTLRGRCLETRFSYSWKPGRQPEQGVGNNLFTLDILKECRGNAHADYDIGLPGPGFIASGEKAYCLYLGDTKGYDSSWFLILRCVDLESRQFERIALLETHNLRDLAVGLVPEDIVHLV